MAGAGKKTFTAGEVLTASDVNTYLMEQSVMYFGGTAARSSAIPTPSTGMTSYIGVTGTASIPQIETYTGSAWQTPYGATLLANVSATAASTITVDNVFTSTYSYYLIVFALNNPNQMQWRSGGSTVAGSGYFSASHYVDSGSGTGPIDRVSAGSWIALRGVDTTFYSINVYRPFEAAVTAISSTYAAGGVSLNSTGYTGAVHSGATSMQGFVINGTTMTGNVRVYGLRNA